uniref:LYR motif containing 7 n=1 Tax=Astyanax mexicanus TaxID=7994 RepID=A0A8B9K5G3_ASTMX
MLKMGTRSKVLRVFKSLHRTRMTVFKEDDRALTGRSCKLKNGQTYLLFLHTFQQMIKMGRAVETILRENVLQAEHVGDSRLLLRPRNNLLLENVPYCETPRKKT